MRHSPLWLLAKASNANEAGERCAVAHYHAVASTAFYLKQPSFMASRPHVCRNPTI
jgi:hypothetical protein